VGAAAPGQIGNFPVIEGRDFLEGQKQGVPQAGHFLAQPLFLLPDEFHQGEVGLIGTWWATPGRMPGTADRDRRKAG